MAAIPPLSGSGGAFTYADIATVNGIQAATLGGSIALLGASGAIPPHISSTYVITNGSALAALTLAAPTATVDDGTVITVTSNTAFAHTITATGLLQTGAATVNVATFAAHPGASVTLMAYQGLWNVISQNAITFS